VGRDGRRLDDDLLGVLGDKPLLDDLEQRLCSVGSLSVHVARF
jgi:hypothetical protein